LQQNSHAFLCDFSFTKEESKRIFSPKIALFLRRSTFVKLRQKRSPIEQQAPKPKHKRTQSAGLAFFLLFWTQKSTEQRIFNGFK
jgi:hypothetical protein